MPKDNRPVQNKDWDELNAVEQVSFKMQASIQSDAVLRRNGNASKDFILEIAKSLIQQAS